MAVRSDLEPCITCGLCRRACPTDTIRYFATGRRTHVVEPAGCIDCDLCVKVCPAFCIHPDPSYTHVPVEREAAKARARAWAGRQNVVRRRRRERALAAVSAAQSGSHA